MTKRKDVFQLGIYAYGVAAIALGLVGFGWRDFAANWQHVRPNVPYHLALALIAAACEVVGGAALLWRKSARAGAALLVITFAVFTALWIPDIGRHPLVYDNWGNFFEELSAFLGGLCAFAVLAPHGSAWRGKARIIARVYGICVISFGVVHITAFRAVVAFVPAWIPPSQRFWAAATTVCFFLAAIAILSGIFATLAARLLAIMIFGFELFVWLPRVAATPHLHFYWSGNVIDTLLGAAAWVIADALAASRRPEPAREEATVA